MVQAVGGSMLMANSAAILTDAFPATQRGMALGINQIAGISGQFVGLLLGGLLAAWDWRAVFWVNVPIGIFGTVWSYRSLREISATRRAKIDWPGNITFALGAGVLLMSITYGIQPYGGHPTGWTNPWVLCGLRGGRGAACGVLRDRDEDRRADVPDEAVQDPGVRGGQRGQPARLDRPGRAAVHAGASGWPGIWLPLHGYPFNVTPLWAGIYMLPLTAGFLLAGPVSGYLSDRFGPRLFATAGLLVAACAFVGLMLLPVDFPYWAFALIIAFNGIGSGLFASPNTSAIMSSVPRGTGASPRACARRSRTSACPCRSGSSSR